MKKVAICVRGAVAKKNTRFPIENQLYSDGHYVNVESVRRSVQRHIVECNPSYSFDFYIHCWSTDIEECLVSLYNPKKYIFEDNRIYNEEIRKGITDANQFGQLSSVLSMGKVLELVEGDYERVILIRPDVLMWKDMVLDTYAIDNIYVNNWIEEKGDFHFVMSPNHTYIFKKMFASALAENKCFGEGWIKKCICDDGRVRLLSDDIEAGKHEEVLRQIYKTSVLVHGISSDVFLQYGLSIQEIREAVVH